MNFCSKVAVKLLVEGVDGDKNLLTSPLLYNAIMNMLAAGSSGKTLDQLLQCLQHNSIEEVNSESSKFAEITSEQPRKESNRKISNVEIEDAGASEAFSKDVDEVIRVDQLSEIDVLTYKLKTYELDLLQPSNQGEAPIISFLNGVWVNHKYSLKDSFQELLQNLYKAKAENIDCEKPGLVVQEINKWVSTSTKGLIEEVLTEEHITEDTLLILGNALYFKGSWEHPFDKESTQCDSFYLLNGEEIKVPFMTGCENYSHKSFEGFQVARIPYSAGGDVNRKFAMYIFLPNEKDGLKSLLNHVDSSPEFFTQHCDLLNGSGKVDIFRIPKFKFSYLTEESPKIMKGMGLTLPFDTKMAELNEMIKEGDLLNLQKVYVSKIIQKAFIEVNEEGTEAAAVTFMSFAPCCYRPPTKLIADHPFMFIIREDISQTLFFAGVVLNPLQQH